jgi:hypothetical protein
VSRWKVRMFEVGEICVHKGYICRVDASERCIVGVTRSSSYAIEDGTEGVMVEIRGEAGGVDVAGLRLR